MCGRFTLISNPYELFDEYGDALASLEYRPRYNIAPGQDVAVLTVRDGAVRAGMMRWGLVPSWAGDPMVGSRLINARAETVAKKPSFLSAFKRRRCLVLADGFYEWTKRGGRKVPIWIHRADRGALAFAGIWERWESDAGTVVGSCAIITTTANPFVRSVYHRMPAILRGDARDAWLRADAEKERLVSLLRPYEGDDLEAYPVSTLVDAPRNDGPECIEPVTQ